jgi:hypothetical protein
MYFWRGNEEVRPNEKFYSAPRCFSSARVQCSIYDKQEFFNVASKSINYQFAQVMFTQRETLSTIACDNAKHGLGVTPGD